MNNNNDNNNNNNTTTNNNKLQTIQRNFETDSCWAETFSKALERK